MGIPIPIPTIPGILGTGMKIPGNSQMPMGMSGNGNRFFHSIFGNSQIFGNSGNGNQIRVNGNSHDWHISA